MINTPMIKKRNCGHCRKGTLYFLHWAKILSCKNGDLNIDLSQLSHIGPFYHISKIQQIYTRLSCRCSVSTLISSAGHIKKFTNQHWTKKRSLAGPPYRESLVQHSLALGLRTPQHVDVFLHDIRSALYGLSV